MSHLFKLVFLSIVVFTLAGKETFDNGNYVVEWMVMSANKEIMFNITAKTIGWVGLGISTQNTGMKKLDVVVACEDDDKPYIWDMYADGKARPTKDEKQNVESLSISQNNGVTKIDFKRKIDTGDTEKDVAIKAGDSYYLAWAYHDKVDAVNPTTFPKHDKRGYSGKITFVAASKTTTVKPPTTTTTASAFSPAVLLLAVAAAVVYALNDM